jgi:DUF971 family protein
VQGHSPEQRVTVGKKKNVKIKELKPVGNYAVRIVFDDGHDTGLYAWSYLQTLDRERDKRWRSTSPRWRRRAEPGVRREGRFKAPARKRRAH